MRQLLKISWRAALQSYFDETMQAPLAAYLAYPSTRNVLQMRLAWCLMGIRRSEHDSSNHSKLKEQQQQLMEVD